MAVESMEADRLLNAGPALGPDYPLEQLGDWSLTVLAELRMQTADAAQEAGLDAPDVLGRLRARAWAALERVLDSPTLVRQRQAVQTLPPQIGPGQGVENNAVGT